jgi:hypothetical protein
MNPFEIIGTQEDKIQYTTIERVIEMVYRDYKFIQNINISDVLEWTGEVYGLINYPGMYRKKITGSDVFTPNITISRYRGELPVDFKRVLKAGVRDYDSKEVYRPSTNTFTQFQYNLNEDPEYANTDKVYSIKGGYIFVEDETATIEMAYEAFPIDSRGYPLVPDNTKVLKYASEYIADKIAFNLLAANKISQFVYLELNKKMLFRAGSAHTALLNRTPDEMETWTWSRLKLMPRIAQHEASFAYLGNREDMGLGTHID